MTTLEIALDKISAQQPRERTPVWMVGEQLKDILRGEPHLAELVIQDLEREWMSLAKCEAKIKEFADKHKTGTFSCVIPSEADGIIREFYGLTEVPRQQTTGNGVVINLEDFF